MSNPLGVAGYGSDSSDSETEKDQIDSDVPLPTAESTGAEVSSEAFKAGPPGVTNLVPPTYEDGSPDVPALPDLPDLPRARCDPTLQAKINKYLEHKERGMSFIESLRNKKEFDNPYILAKVVEYFSIEEMQTNFPKDVFDPYGYDLGDYMEKLSMEVQKEQERRGMLVQQNPSLRWTQPSLLS
ncbi:hypothetical protein H310_03970 [Aphanomyces invadans]|uniref:HCNGP-like protein n=1 Tax=Aphanomyces invadans TaxID=157072 RepID=A0A024UG48_9STRA|nr:hypothetical protein H310_03970 [Aphanomyces invadans]ETW04847.1 hypothetical protein H310_03970 [Aphanomyces invadans]RHY26571.1 hypothetical protein DYB32_007489 [Aphanomyces invadans]|eukprot:XP_008866285.1 hypothetical protein H310_03970 [Aphanomyces invadans]